MSSPWQSGYGRPGRGGTSSLRVTEAQRERVLDHINDAYAHGVIDDAERERRTETALLARTRTELDQSYRGIPSFTPSVPEALRVPVKATPDLADRRKAGLSALSAVLLGPVGPAIGMAVTKRGSWARGQTVQQLVVALTATAVWALALAVGAKGVMYITSMLFVVVVAVQAVRGFRGP